MQATMKKMTQQFNQKEYDKYVAREVKAMTKAREKGHRDFKHFSDQDILDAAHSLARIYNAGTVYV